MAQIQGDIILEGRTVTLIPMASSHKEALFEAVGKPEVWQYTWGHLTTLEDISDAVERALAHQRSGSHIPFVIVDNASGRIVGATRIGDMDAANRNAEIGWTWLSPDVWRTRVNTECKFLLLSHVFEQMHVLRVQFSVSSYNLRSQRAVERIGAVREGIFRKHRIKVDGTIHDNIFYSILDTEWPEVKSNLLYLLETKYSE
ncbi:GNAT family N-acetyltransferase [Paenibacillus sp. SI8]|uniref:GNAT family N-acetyltransferase n=1 Tax=unclassified Paenibacillus TaxID=185978 RepID=UPI003465672F